MNASDWEVEERWVQHLLCHASMVFERDAMRCRLCGAVVPESVIFLSRESGAFDATLDRAGRTARVRDIYAPKRKHRYIEMILAFWNQRDSKG